MARAASRRPAFCSRGGTIPTASPTTGRGISVRTLNVALILYGVLIAVALISAGNFSLRGDGFTLSVIGCLLLIPLLLLPLITLALFRTYVIRQTLTPSRFYLALGMAIASLIVILLFYLVSPLFLIGLLIPNVAKESVTYLISLILPFLLSMLGAVLDILSIRIIRKLG